MELGVVRDASGCAVLLVSGEVDMSGSEELRTAGVDAIRADGHGRLRTDLSAVTFLDSTGLGALIYLRNVTHEQPGALVLVDPSEPVLRLLTLTGLDDAFTISNRPRDSAPLESPESS